MALYVHKLQFSEGSNGKRKDKVILLEQKWRPYGGKPATLQRQDVLWEGAAEDLLKVLRTNGLEVGESG